MSDGPYDDDFEWVPYARISDDREGGGLGAGRQVKDNTALGKRLGGRILAACVDNDLTAYDKSARYRGRPGYEQLCALLRERPGRRGVLVWHTDRLHRTPRELEDFIDLVEATNAPVQTVRAGQLDLSTASGRMTARVHCAVARHESEHKSERIRRKVEELAADGKIGNGGPRPFGYRRVYAGEGTRRKILRDDLEPVEAEVIRDSADRLLAGDSLRSIVKDLNDRGIRTSTAGQPRKRRNGTVDVSNGLWTMQALRWVLRSGRIAGLREHRGVVVGTAQWPAIIDKETHEQLRARLDSNERPPGSRVRLHYLSGWVEDDVCGPRGVKMRVASAHKGQLKYRCPPAPEGGCNGRLISLPDLVDFVDRHMIDRLSDPQTLRDLAAREATEDAVARTLVEQIQADERRLRLLQASMSDGDESELPEVVASVRVIRRRVAEAREQLGRRAGMPSLVRESLPDLADRWPVLDLAKKQALLALFVERIVISPARRGLARFDPARVDIVPAGSPRRTSRQ